jgi:hypothetical protein
MTPPLAAPLLRYVLEGLDALFAKTRIGFWQEQVRRVAAAEDATIAAGYQHMAQGSAPGTFHDLIISVRNGHRVTEVQEPFLNELLATLQSMGMAAATAISADGVQAAMSEGADELAARHVWHYVDGSSLLPPRAEHVVTGMRCKTCGTRYTLDDSPRWAAARRWSLTVAPGRIAAGRSRGLVDAALDPQSDSATRIELERMRAPFDALGLHTISLPYNKPGNAPNDRCRTCGADDWGTTHWRLVGQPPRLEPI